MKHSIQLLIIIALFFAGCGKGQHVEDAAKPITETVREDVSGDSDAEKDLANEITKGALVKNTAVSVDNDGSIRFNLADTASVLIKSIPESKGVILTNTEAVKDITNSLTVCKPYNPGDNYVPEYDYSLIFYDAAGIELATIKAYDNFVVTYEGNTYYDAAEQFYMAKVRNLYIEKMKESFTCDMTSFCVNGEVHDLKDIDSSINAITEHTWFGFEDFPEPTIVFLCHINPKVGYCAVFDVEKLAYVFGAYGVGFTWSEGSASTIIYTYQDTVYNYWGDSIYINKDKDSYIYQLEFDVNANVMITLASQKGEKLTKLTRINYHKYKDDFSDDRNLSDESKLLAEFKADLMHNGRKEFLRLTMRDSAGELAALNITDANGKLMWLEQAHTSHAGWNSVYLCEMDGEDYLFAFNPYQNTGLASYMYVLFYFSGQDTIEMADSGYYTFDYGAKEGTGHAFNKKAFQAFAEKVNTYLRSSYLLMSTEGGELRYSTEEKHLAESEEYETDRWTDKIMSELY